MSLNLCIDIDGTITEAYYWLDAANRYFNSSIQPYQVKEYDIHHVLDVSREDYQEFYRLHWQELHGNAKPRKYAELVLWKLFMQHNISYVTAREPVTRDTTVQWLRRHGMPEMDLHMLGSHYKVDKAKELDCDIFVEDRYENAVELALSGFQVLLMDCSYNRKPLIPGITRVTNWLDVHEEIETIKLKKQKLAPQIA
ncbi:hypothetical protein [Gudongella sp. SC589]|jgi:hypothetical protein|uniref:hypothetical protein n=1 Tax=Gudongella sp. SC589 TaxID=3385990 RepID=UPI003904739D